MGMPVSAEDKLSELKESKALPRAKWHVCSNGKNLDRLVIGVGQLHPVPTGKFEAFQANRIAKVQAWIFDTLEYLYQKQGVKTFGQEGFSSGGSDLRKARLDDSILDQLKQVIEKHSSTESFLRRIAQ